jgi:hypothetical protein
LRSRRGVRSLLRVSSVTLLVMIALDREAQHQYLIHFVLWMISLTAVAGVWYWDRQSVPRWVLASALAVLVMIQTATTARRVMQRAYSTNYLATTNYLKHTRGERRVMGVRTGVQRDTAIWSTVALIPRQASDFIVVDKNRYAEWIPQYELRAGTYRYIRGMIDGIPGVGEPRYRSTPAAGGVGQDRFNRLAPTCPFTRTKFACRLETSRYPCRRCC